MGWLRWIGPRKVASSVGAVLAVAIIGWWLLKPNPPDATAQLSRVDSVPTAGVDSSVAVEPSLAPATEVVVHVAGSVSTPGVYTLGGGSRVVDAVAAAGGALPRARVDALNLAAELRDGEQIYVPAIGEVVTAPAGAMASTGSQFPLDLNVATIEQLDQLPGVGPATASAIVTRRSEIGRFVSVDDLLDVPGLGPAKVAAIRGLVTV
jgi:competence protein ComEA